MRVAGDQGANLGTVPLAHGNNLASLELNKGDYDAAQPVLARLLTALEKLKGYDDPETVKVRSLLDELASRRND